MSEFGDDVWVATLRRVLEGPCGDLSLASTVRV
jgi:hypothetical protein